MSTVKRIEVTQAFNECPDCGYQNGFHVSVRRIEPNGDARKLAVHLICPSCSAIYDIGLALSLPEEH